VRKMDGAIVPLYDFRLSSGQRLVFTTTADGQREAVFDFFYREQGSSGWTYLDSLRLTHLPPAPAGAPDLVLGVTPEACGDLQLQLLDPATGRPCVFLLEAQKLDLFLRTGAAARGVPAPAPAPIATEPRRRSRLLLVLACAAAFAAGATLLYLNTSQRKGKLADPGTVLELPSPSGNPDSETRLQAAMPAASPASAPSSEEYRIRWGDTLWRIAERYYGERRLYRELAESNQLQDPDLIISGETLQLPTLLGGQKRKTAAQ